MMPPISNGRWDDDAPRRSAGRHAIVPARFGSDEQCREHLFKARWPDGSQCAACGHDDAYALRTEIVYECVACRKQHSLLAGTIFEQTKTGLAKWLLATYLATSSKGGIAATELRRQ